MRLQTSSCDSAPSQGSLTVEFQAIQVRSPPADLVSVAVRCDVIVCSHDQDLVLRSTFAVQMCVTCIDMRDCLKVKHICACSLKCEVLYCSVFVWKE